MVHKLDYGDEVYFLNDKDALPHMVTGFVLRPQERRVLLSYCGIEVSAYDIEITKDINELLRFNN
jgi:hypothetical protein